jgi:hypothetical protein
MILPESELQRCRALVASAFPRFGSWEFVNAPHHDYVGFTIWGAIPIWLRAAGTRLFCDV